MTQETTTTAFEAMSKNAQSLVAHGSYIGEIDRESVADCTDEEVAEAEEFWSRHEVESQITSDDDDNREFVDKLYRQDMEADGFTVFQYIWGDGDNSIINLAYKLMER